MKTWVAIALFYFPINLFSLASSTSIHPALESKQRKYSGKGNNLPLLRHCLLDLGSDPWNNLIDVNSNPSYYNIVNHQWNIRKEKVYPFAYFLPNFTPDVQNIVLCGRWMGIQLVPNSGGHNYEALSYGCNDSLIIDFRLMNRVTLLPDRFTAQIQPGALLGRIYAQLWMQGKRGISAGMCLTVGIGGNVIGGGVGYMDSVFGLAADNLLEVEMVTADGAIVVANEIQNPDLFWALRGVGSGLIGIVTGFRFRTFDAEHLKISIVKLDYHLSAFPTAMMAIQRWYKWSEEHSPNVLVLVNVVDENYTSEFAYNRPSISIELIHMQDAEYNPEDNTKFLRGAYEIFSNTEPKPNDISKFFPSYMQFLLSTFYYTPVNFPLSNGTSVKIGILSNPALNDDPLYGYGAGGFNEETALRRLLALRKDLAVERFFKLKSFFIDRDITLEELERINHHIQKIPHNKAWIMINTENGRIHRVGRSQTAYVHRNIHFNFVINVESLPEYGDTTEAMKWMYDLWNDSQSFDSGETYNNYPDFDVPDHFERNYKENFPALVQCKAKWDPYNYFNWGYSLPTSI